MSFNANDRESGDFITYEALEPKAYPARLVQLVLMGVQPSQPYKGHPKDPRERMYVAYELSHEFLPDEDGNPDPTKPRWIGEDFAFFNLGADRAKSTLRYEALDPSHAAEGDWLKLVGSACNVTVTKEPRKDKKGETNYVSSISPAMDVPGYEQPALVNEPRIFDIDQPDMEVFETLPKWLQDKLKTNLNYNGSALQKALGETPVESEAPPAAPSAPKPPVPPAPPAPDGSAS